MDNLTHSLVGLTAAKAGLEKLSPGATTLSILAANSPDIDVVVLIFRGRSAFLQHHRGITHAIIGASVLALALPLIFYVADRIIARVKTREPQVRLKGLILVSIITTATHPLLDWTNNYGMRFLLPWSPKWSYGDFTFVIDPFFWMILGGAAFLATAKKRSHVIIWLVLALIATVLVMSGAVGLGSSGTGPLLRLLWIIVLVAAVILYRRGFGERAGPKIAIAALLTVTIYCAGLLAAHVLAFRRAQVQANTIADSHAEQILRLAVMPTPANPAGWVVVMESDRATYRFNLSLLRAPTNSSPVIRYEKLAGPAAQAVAEAERNSQAKIFLGFARFPVMRVVGEDCATQRLVQFADLRYTEPGRGRGTFSLDVPVQCPVEDKQK